MNTFDMALRGVCDSLAAPCTVFDPSTDVLLLAKRAFRRELGALPTSRTTFEQLFEPAAAPTAGNLISTRTVELHRAGLMYKLGVRNLPDLVKVYLGYR